MIAKSKLEWLKRLRGVPMPPNEYRVLVTLCGYTSSDGSNAFPSVRRLADDCCMTERSVQRILRSLEKAGRIVQTSPGGNAIGKGRAAVYAVQEVIPKPDTSVTLDDPGRATAVSGKGDSSVVSSPTPVSPHPLKDLSIHLSTQNRGDIDWEAAAIRAAETDRTNQVDPTTAAAIFEPVRKLISAGKEAELKRNSYFAGNCQICGRNHRLCRSVAAKSGDTHDYTPAGARSSTAAEG